MLTPLRLKLGGDMAETTHLYAGTQDGMVVVQPTSKGWEIANQAFGD